MDATEEYSMMDFNNLFVINPFDAWVKGDAYVTLWNEMREAYWQTDRPKEERDRNKNRARQRALDTAKRLHPEFPELYRDSNDRWVKTQGTYGAIV